MNVCWSPECFHSEQWRNLPAHTDAPIYPHIAMVTHIYRKISAQANPFIDFKLQTLLIRRHQIICFSMSECVGFCMCVCFHTCFSGDSPDTAMYVLPMVFIFSMSWNRSSPSSCRERESFNYDIKLSSAASEQVWWICAS